MKPGSLLKAAQENHIYSTRFAFMRTTHNNFAHSHSGTSLCVAFHFNSISFGRANPLSTGSRFFYILDWGLLDAWLLLFHFCMEMMKYYLNGIGFNPFVEFFFSFLLRWS